MKNPSSTHGLHIGAGLFPQKTENPEQGFGNRSFEPYLGRGASQKALLWHAWTPKPEFLTPKPEFRFSAGLDS